QFLQPRIDIVREPARLAGDLLELNAEHAADFRERFQGRLAHVFQRAGQFLALRLRRAGRFLAVARKLVAQSSLQSLHTFEKYLLKRNGIYCETPTSITRERENNHHDARTGD